MGVGGPRPSNWRTTRPVPPPTWRERSWRTLGNGDDGEAKMATHLSKPLLYGSPRSLAASLLPTSLPSLL